MPVSGATISVRALAPIVSACARIGLNVAPALATRGVSSQQLADWKQRVPQDVSFALWAEIARLDGSTTAGLRIAQQLNLKELDLMGHLLRASGTLAEAYQTMVRYYCLVHDMAALQLEVDSGGARLLHRLPPGLGTLPALLAEFLVATWFRMGRELVGSDWTPRKICFIHAAPRNLAEHRRLFRCPLVFSAEQTELSVPAHALALPVLFADAGLLSVLRRQADEVKAQQPAVTWVDRVRSEQAQALPAGGLDAAALARKFGMSTRTLQRRLRELDTSPAALLDGLRREQALRMMGDRQVPLGEVVFELGFSQPSAFHRAFRRWTGKTPVAYRNALR